MKGRNVPAVSEIHIVNRIRDWLGPLRNLAPSDMTCCPTNALEVQMSWPIPASAAASGIAGSVDNVMYDSTFDRDELPEIQDFHDEAQNNGNSEHHHL